MNELCHSSNLRFTDWMESIFNLFVGYLSHRDGATHRIAWTTLSFWPFGLFASYTQSIPKIYIWYIPSVNGFVDAVKFLVDAVSRVLRKGFSDSNDTPPEKH